MGHIELKTRSIDKVLQRPCTRCKSYTDLVYAVEAKFCNLVASKRSKIIIPTHNCLFSGSV